MLRRFCIAGMLYAGLVLPVHADLAGDVGTLEEIFNTVCGPRYDVIWVDEAKELPPCLMSYSQYCEEIQVATPNSCQNILGDRAANLTPPEPGDDTAVTTASVQQSL